MRLTVLEFAEHYKIKEADASKLLRRAALDERIQGSIDLAYKAIYYGSYKTFDSLATAHFERIAKRKANSARNLEKSRAPKPWRGFPQPVGHITSPGKGLF